MLRSMRSAVTAVLVRTRVAAATTTAAALRHQVVAATAVTEI